MKVWISVFDYECRLHEGIEGSPPEKLFDMSEEEYEEYKKMLAEYNRW